MTRAQGSLEYLIIIAVAISITAVVSLIAINYLSGGQATYSLNACKEAAALCKATKEVTPNDPCNTCDNACTASDGSEIFEGAARCCKIGKPEMVYEGSGGCEDYCISSSECNSGYLCCNSICTYTACSSTNPCFFNERAQPCIESITCTDRGTCKAKCDYDNPVLKSGCCSPDAIVPVNCPAGQTCCIIWSGGKRSQAYGECCGTGQTCLEGTGCVTPACYNDNDCVGKVTPGVCETPKCYLPGEAGAYCGVAPLPGCECDNDQNCIDKYGSNYRCFDRQCRYVRCFTAADCGHDTFCTDPVCYNAGTPDASCSWIAVNEGVTCAEGEIIYNCATVGGKPGTCITYKEWECSSGTCSASLRSGRCYMCDDFPSTYELCNDCDPATGACWDYACKTTKGYYCSHTDAPNCYP